MGISKWGLIGALLLSPLASKNIETYNDSYFSWKKVIVLDPGHGKGNAGWKMDPGTVWGKYREADIVLEQAKITKKILEKNNKYVVFLTRENNEDVVSLESRSEYANKKNADLFVSIHLNHYSDKSVKGFEVYYRNKDSKNLAEVTLENFKEEINTRSRGVKYGSKKVLKDLDCPGILIEGGFLSNPEDQKYILDTIPDIEQAIANSIDDYFKEKDF